MTRKDDLGNENATTSSEITNTDTAGSGKTVDDPKNTTLTGSDLPKGDGMVADDDLEKISGESDNRPTGQDHSAENRENQMPTEGVGALQSQNDTTSDIAHIENKEKK